ncbi:hypothetical protein [Nodularia sphaerocarpa]|uniref:hypothetical protein n=1 Tax=Nodularia sphaerocarpa TaxID=137816 RepID=UPI001EFB10F8|nr:hypothetical protein [Nodularia sphaerocarpa]MDB9375842.1 hypothetical protein [Nodularia sphaerocarpa CS-585]MDB9379344.1 hypothetical protein [Nodularia sphaerocarpa CS-585A2]
MLTICESATAQLRVNENRSIPKGQESEFLNFQRQNNQNMRQMRIMPDCSVGSGLGCNKTGTVVERIINQSNGTNYQDMLMRAAGGQDNYNKFAAFYGNNPQIPNIPYASFWKNEDPSILDGSRYVLGEPVSRNPLSGLKSVTNNFAWSPSSRAREISPRDGLLNLKYAYGRVLFEEAAKIPNLEQQIKSLNLPPEMTKFYVDNISQGIRNLKTGNESGLRQSVLRVLSFPHSPGVTNDGWFNRTLINLPASEVGVAPLLPDTFVGLIPPIGGSEIVTGFIPPTFGEVLAPATAIPWLPYTALVPLLWLLFNAGGGGGDEVSAQAPPLLVVSPEIPPVIEVPPGTPPVIEVPPETPPVTEVPPETPPVTVVPPETPPVEEVPPGTPPVIVVPPETPPVTKVPEPSALNALLLLTVALGMLNYKQRLVHTKS